MVSLALDPEELVNWYLRLNGFMTIPGFVLHPNRSKGPKKTDVDIFGVRFSHHIERGFIDEPIFTSSGKDYFVIGEVKASLCKLNGPWKEPENENMEYVLRAIGVFPDESQIIKHVAGRLYREQKYEDDSKIIQIVGFGKTKNENFADLRKPNVQLDFKEVLAFIFRRFDGYLGQKRDNAPWDEAGRVLFQLAEKYSRFSKRRSGERTGEDAFIEEASDLIDLTVVMNNPEKEI